MGILCRLRRRARLASGLRFGFALFALCLAGCATALRTALYFPEVSSGSRHRAIWFQDLRDKALIQDMRTWRMEKNGKTFVVNALVQFKSKMGPMPVVELHYLEVGQGDDRVWELLGIAVTVDGPGSSEQINGLQVAAAGNGSAVLGKSPVPGEGAIANLKSSEPTVGVFIDGRLRRFIELRKPELFWESYGLKPWGAIEQAFGQLAESGNAVAFKELERELGLPDTQLFSAERAKIASLRSRLEQVAEEKKAQARRGEREEDAAFSEKWKKGYPNDALALYIERTDRVQRRGYGAAEDEARHRRLLTDLETWAKEALAEGRVATAAVLSAARSRMSGEAVQTRSFSAAAEKEPTGNDVGNRQIAALAQELVPAITTSSPELKGALERVYSVELPAAWPISSLLGLVPGVAGSSGNASQGASEVATIRVVGELEGQISSKISRVNAEHRYVGAESVPNPEYADWVASLKAKEERLAELGEAEDQSRAAVYEKKLVELNVYTVGSRTKTTTVETNQSIAERQQAAVDALAKRAMIRQVKDEYQALLKDEPPLKISRPVDKIHKYQVEEQRWTGSLTRTVQIEGASLDHRYQQTFRPNDSWVYRRVCCLAAPMSPHGRSDHRFHAGVLVTSANFSFPNQSFLFQALAPAPGYRIPGILADRWNGIRNFSPFWGTSWA